MNQFEIISKIYSIIGEYKKQNVESFYVSSIIEDLKYNGIDYYGMERDVILALNSLVNSRMLEKNMSFLILRTQLKKEYINTFHRFQLMIILNLILMMFILILRKVH